ncbi:MAG TPA: hypothetical protein VFR81_00810 [Longimicrobium sp.]|nr:hypothetical protein [Longimicrobium sp.]
MGIKKMIAKKVVWPAVTTGTAWAAERVMDRGLRKTKSRKRVQKKGSLGRTLALTAATAAVSAVVGVLAEQAAESAVRRVKSSRRRDD